ncbi:hypothetical protein [Staphylococcus equorum]|uniref:Uncharacterized protein n=1 Tax=Staphylococcus equorum TaxID=246432 RepID=A0A9X4R2X8_9STAP|nr:hypothetical protein [Staphylococcus equorum]MDG0860384.1 hypothetical protein [Staphylococcus equorum]
MRDINKELSKVVHRQNQVYTSYFKEIERSVDDFLDYLIFSSTSMMELKHSIKSFEHTRLTTIPFEYKEVISKLLKIKFEERLINMDIEVFKKQRRKL